MLKPVANVACRRGLPFHLALTALLILSVSAAVADDPLSIDANRQFLTSHAHQPGVIARTSGVQYRILTRGFGRHPGASDSVEITYSAHLIDGTVVDRATGDLPATVSVSTALHGLGEALQLMQVGDHWEIVVPADLALGSKQVGATPPNQTLIFDLTLLAIVPPSYANATQESGSFSAFSREHGKDTEVGGIISISP